MAASSVVNQERPRLARREACGGGFRLGRLLTALPLFHPLLRGLGVTYVPNWSALQALMNRRHVATYLRKNKENYRRLRSRFCRH